MAGDTMRFRNPAGHAGLLNNLLSLANSLAGFFETRITLFARESKSALVHILLLAAGLIGGLLLLAFGYVFLIVSAVLDSFAKSPIRLSKKPTRSLTSASRLWSKPACPAGLRNRIESPAIQPNL